MVEEGAHLYIVVSYVGVPLYKRTLIYCVPYIWLAVGSWAKGRWVGNANRNSSHKSNNYRIV